MANGIIEGTLAVGEECEGTATAVLSSPVVLLNSAPRQPPYFLGPLLTRSVAPPTAVQKLLSVRLRTA
jgi:hypothetical protein